MDLVLHEDEAGHLGCLGQDRLELGQQLVRGDHDLNLGLVDRMNNGVFTKISVQSNNREGLLETGLENVKIILDDDEDVLMIT